MRKSIIIIQLIILGKHDYYNTWWYKIFNTWRYQILMVRSILNYTINKLEKIVILILNQE